MITKEILRKIAPTAKESIIADLEKYFDKYLEKYEINTYLRVCHFLAQAAHESAGFRTLEEYATGSAYEGRRDLGNVKTGDGRRYKGRGIFQLTGRANYRDMGRKLGLDLEGNPELAELPEVSVLTACEYWNSRKLSKYADDDDVVTVTRKINGGENGLPDRKQYLKRAKAILKEVIDPEDLPGEDENNVVLAKRGENSDYVKEIQQMLIDKGANIEADGDFGIRTELAVKEFQKAVDLEVTGMIDTNTLNKLVES